VHIQNGQPGASDWGWTRAGDGPLYELGCLMFVRGATAERVLEAYGVRGAKMLTWEHRWADAAEEQDGCLRVGLAGEWAFAIEEWSINTVLSGMQAGESLPGRLSAATDVIVVSYVGSKALGGFEYYADGQCMTSFEPMMADQRAGDAPDRFLAEMDQAGLDVAGDAEYDPEFDDIVAALQTVTLAFGIRLPEAVAHGPLLTGYVENEAA
jgi:hypothetical protein